MDKVVECLNTKSYSLTLNKGYPIIDESEDLYTIKNDNNVVVKYGKPLFSEPFETVSFDNEFNTNMQESVPVAVPVAIPTPVAPPVELHNLQEIMSSLTINIANDSSIVNNDNNLMYVDLISLKLSINNTITIDGYVKVYPRECSCGIYDIVNLNNQYQYIQNKTATISHLTDGEKEELTNYIFARCISKLINITGVNLYNLSTNIDCNNYESIKEVIESFLNVTSITTHNPNSGNEIILWTIKMN
jgi:hypothetical protein